MTKFQIEELIRRFGLPATRQCLPIGKENREILRSIVEGWEKPAWIIRRDKLGHRTTAENKALRKIKELEGTVVALQEDKELLDWVGANCGHEKSWSPPRVRQDFFGVPGWRISKLEFSLWAPTLRQVIRLAMAKEEI